MSVPRAVKFGLAIILASVAALFQGWAVFWIADYGGPFASRTGLACVGVPLLVELVVFIVAMRNLDQLHANAVANPHSLLGQSLRRDTPPAPPPSRAAWDGGWEDPGKATDKMGSDR